MRQRDTFTSKSIQNNEIKFFFKLEVEQHIDEHSSHDTTEMLLFSQFPKKETGEEDSQQDQRESDAEAGPETEGAGAVRIELGLEGKLKGLVGVLNAEILEIEISSYTARHKPTLPF